MISVEELEKIHPEKYAKNDIGTSKLFVAVWKNKIVYVPERKGFFVYNGKVWEKDIEDLKTHEMAKEFTVSIIEYFREKKPDDDAVLKYYSKFLSRGNRLRIIDDAKSICPVSFEKFDRQPYFINCQNCTIDVATGDTHQHNPMDYLTKISNVWYEPSAKSPDFIKFINSVMQEKEELIAYLQRALGYSITAATFMECFFITYGSTTRNGKGTLNSTIMHMLGDYAKASPYETFTSKKFKGNGGGASENIARLAGSRYVSVSEPAEGITLDSALIKTLSGNDVITARNLYESSFEFVASFKLWINTNHLPAIPDDTVFKSGRVQLIPFNKHFSEKEQDKGLKSRLITKENISGIFNWCMEGLQFLIKEGGLKTPDTIQNEIDKYQQDNDRISEFLNDCFVIADSDNKNRVKISAVYKIYCNWCKENGYKPWNKKNLKSKLSEKVTVKTIDHQDHLVGYRIEPDTPQEWYD